MGRVQSIAVKILIICCADVMLLVEHVLISENHPTHHMASLSLPSVVESEFNWSVTGQRKKNWKEMIKLLFRSHTDPIISSIFPLFMVSALYRL